MNIEQPLSEQDAFGGGEESIGGLMKQQAPQSAPENTKVVQPEKDSEFLSLQEQVRALMSEQANLKAKISE